MTIEIRQNCTLVGTRWQPVSREGSGSLAQYDASATDVIGGEVVFASTTGAPARSGELVVSSFDLKAIKELNNSILGGDRTYPDGPDTYTVIVKSNPSIASTDADVTFRWAEQQS